MADQDLTLDATLLGGDGTLGAVGEATMAQTEDMLEMARRSTARPDLPGYVLSSRLGSGTFGEAWAGEQLSTGQKVAVKVITRAASLDILRFRQEVQRLIEVAEHPNVVTLLDANLDHSPPFFVMPLLASSLGEVQAGPEQVGVWLEQVAEGLRYIHSKGILHGDLKPANILLDGEGRARLADFGQSFATQEGGYNLGTIGFMAPEQIQRALRRNQLVADERWDIYALGASAYRLLTGEIPRLDQRARASLATIGVTERLQVCVELTQGPLKPVRSLNPLVDRDLAAIVEGCLEVIPAHRYADASALLEDLRRRKDLLPLYCMRPWTSLYRARLFVRRYPALVGMAALSVTLLVGSVMYGWSEIRRQSAVLERERADMASERKLADVRLEGLNDQIQRLVQLEANFAGAAARKGDLDEAALWWGRALQTRDDDQVLWLQLQSFPFALANLLQLPPDSTGMALDPRGKWLVTLGDGANLWDLKNGNSVRLNHPPGAQLAAFSRDGRRLATAADWGEARLWNPTDRRLEKVLSFHAGRDQTRFVSDPESLRATVLTFSPAGRSLLLGTASGEASVFELASGQPTARYQVPGAVVAAGMLDDRPPLLVDERGQAWLGRQPLGVDGVRDLDLDPTVQRALLRGPRTTLLDPRTGRIVAQGPGADLVGFCRGQAVLAGREVSLLDGRSGKLRHRWRLPGRFRPLALSPFGELAAAEGEVLRVFEVETGRPISGFLWHLAPIQQAEFNQVGELATRAGGRVRVFQAASSNGYRPAWKRPGSRLALTGELVALAAGRQVVVCEMASGKPVGAPLELPGQVDFLGFGPEDRLVARSGRQLSYWTRDSHETAPAPADLIAIAPDGKEIVAESRQLRTADRTFNLPRPARALGTLLDNLCVADDRELRIGLEPKPLAVMAGHFEWLEESAPYLVAGERRRLVLIERREIRQALSAEESRYGVKPSVTVSVGKVGAVAFASDITCHARGPDTLLVGTRLGMARLFRIAGLRPLGEELRHEAPVVATALTTRLAATADAEGRVYLWAMPQLSPLSVGRPGARVTDLAFASHGDLLVCAGGQTTCWRLPERVCQASEAERLAERITGFALDARQMLRPLSPQEWRDRLNLSPVASPSPAFEEVEGP